MHAKKKLLSTKREFPVFFCCFVFSSSPAPVVLLDFLMHKGAASALEFTAAEEKRREEKAITVVAE